MECKHIMITGEFYCMLLWLLWKGDKAASDFDVKSMYSLRTTMNLHGCCCRRHRLPLDETCDHPLAQLLACYMYKSLLKGIDQITEAHQFTINGWDQASLSTGIGYLLKMLSWNPSFFAPPSYSVLQLSCLSLGMRQSWSAQVVVTPSSKLPSCWQWTWP